MKTTLRNFQRQFAAMRVQADAGETVVIEAEGKPRYVFTLVGDAEPQSLSCLFARATSDIDVKRDKSTMRRP